MYTFCRNMLRGGIDCLKICLSIAENLDTFPKRYFIILFQSANSLAENRLWTALEHLTDNLHKLFLALLKCSPEAKQCTLNWVAGCLHSNAARGKMWNSQVIFNFIFM